MRDRLRHSADGVRLRDVEARDLPALFEQQRDPDANRMAVTNPRDAESFQKTWTAILCDPSNIARAIIVDDAVAGYVSCFKLDGLDAVGYWLAKEQWGKGIATRALTLLLAQVAIRPLQARVARSNVASIRVLEKCGFRLSGYHWAPATDRFPACEEALFVLD